MEALDKFRKKLADIEKRIFDMNRDDKLKNRFGPVKMPYTLLVPTSKVGLTGRGIPNSVSI
jgi:linoleate 9S-lipoxygenase